MNPLDPESNSVFAQWVGSIAAAVGITAVTVQKLMKGWASDKVGRVSDNAQADVVQGLRSELERLRTQNSLLSDSLIDMQKTVHRISGENARLQREIADLQDDIARMIRNNRESNFSATQQDTMGA
jgi:septal ring factor EnvC (AmiA/AmiB activator)